MKMSPITPPVYVAVAGLIRATVWEAQAGETLQHKIVVSRLYRQNGSWHRAKTFMPRELNAVAEVITDAQEWINQRTQTA